jgi:hypothetical protein
MKMDSKEQIKNVANQNSMDKFKLIQKLCDVSEEEAIKLNREALKFDKFYAMESKRLDLEKKIYLRELEERFDNEGKF